MSTTRPFHITPARTEKDIADTRTLLEAYANYLAIDLSIQDFSTELATLPGKYAPPGGEILLARTPEGEALGCVALRPLDKPGQCEGKRLFVPPANRGLGIGKALMNAIVRVAAERGYENFWGDTLPQLKGAIALHEKMGMVPTEPYHDAFVDGSLFVKYDLSALRTSLGIAKS